MTQLPITNTYDHAFSALMQVMDTANSSGDLVTLGRTLLDRVLAATTMARGSIWLNDQGQPTCLAHYPARQGNKSPVADAGVRRVLETGHAEFHGKSGITMPLIARGERIGVLVLNDGPEAPSHSLLSAIASWIASELQQVRLAEQLEAQQQRLQAISFQQEELLSIISHDLRNPMASIKGYADLLLRRSARIADDPNRRGLQIISEQIVRMSGLLDELLDISRISSERLQIDRREDDLSRLVAWIVAQLGGTQNEVQIALEGADVPLPCAIDTSRMQQTITNVLDNAITFSPVGSVIDVRLERNAEEAIITIRDRGIGIAKEDAPRVFEPFFHGSNGNSRHGMGMGLFVAQQILQRHDGRIWFESTPGQGSTFFIAVPLLQASQPAKKAS